MFQRASILAFPSLTRKSILSYFPQKVSRSTFAWDSASGGAGVGILTVHSFHEVQGWGQLPLTGAVVSCDGSPLGRRERPGRLKWTVYYCVGGGFSPASEDNSVLSC